MIEDRTQEPLIDGSSPVQHAPELDNPPITTEQYNSPHKKSRAIFIVTAIVMGLAAIPLSLALLFVSALLLSDTGFFGTKQDPWGPSYVFLLGIPVLFLAVIRMIKQEAWNSILLFSSVPAAYIIVLSQRDFLESSATLKATAYLFSFVFVAIWILLFRKRTKLSFLIGWPFVAGMLSYLSLEQLRISNVSLTYEPFLVIALGLAAWLLVFFNSRFKYADYAAFVIAIIVVWAIPSYALDPERYASEAPSSAIDATQAADLSVADNLRSTTLAGGYQIDLIDHGHLRFNGLSAPQVLGEDILVPYKQPGSNCNDWVALDVSSFEFSYALLGEVGYCTQPVFVKTYPENDIVIHGNLVSMQVKRISDGVTILDLDSPARMLPQLIDNNLYFVYSENLSTGQPVTVSAFDITNESEVWTTSVTGVLHPDLKQFVPNSNQIQLNKRELFLSTDSQLLLQLEELDTDEVRQYAINHEDGNTVQLSPPATLSYKFADRLQYYIPQDDLLNTFSLDWGLNLADVLNAITIKGELVSLPEPCITFPVHFQGNIICNTEKHIMIIRANLEESDIPESFEFGFEV